MSPPPSAPDLADVVRATRTRAVAALAVRFRDLDLAEDAFGEACARAAEAWPREAAKLRDPAAYLYRIAVHAALDTVRRRRTGDRLTLDAPEPEPTPEEALSDDTRLIPDDRLRLIFVCCHPSVAPDVRAALTLRTVCGLSTSEIARAFLVGEAALQQRLVRAKRKIADAGLPFEVPEPQAWAERVDAVLSTLEIAYAKAHEDAAGASPHAGYAREMLTLTRVLAELMPIEPEVLAFAALVRYAEARRAARLDITGTMVPLSEQDPTEWDRALIARADRYMERAAVFRPVGTRTLQAMIHATWCGRSSLADAAPWPQVLRLYDALVALRDDPVIRLNRTVAVAEVSGVAVALDEMTRIVTDGLESYPPFQALRADLLARAGRTLEALAAYDRALALEPPPAERRWLERRRASLIA